MTRPRRSPDPSVDLDAITAAETRAGLAWNLDNAHPLLMAIGPMVSEIRELRAENKRLLASLRNELTISEARLSALEATEAGTARFHIDDMWTRLGLAGQECERLRAIIEKVRSHSRPVRYVVEIAEHGRVLTDAARASDRSIAASGFVPRVGA